jgi:transcriptional regulator with GAF, ATPase, and Fis domain
MKLDEMIRRQITEALRQSQFRRTYAATLLGIERRRLNRLITRLKINLGNHDSLP